MNSDRRNELTKLLEQIAGIKSSDTTFALMGQVDARDILDLLNETTNEGTAMKESEAKERLRDLVKPGARWRPTDLVQAARDLLNAEREDALPWKVVGDVCGVHAGFARKSLAETWAADKGPGFTITGPDLPA